MGKAWVKARRRDPYYRAAKAQGLRSRAVFKLLQIHERFGLVYPGDLILDLGASPGGWSRAPAELGGPRGRVVAVDRVSIAPMDRVPILRGDFLERVSQCASLDGPRRAPDLLNPSAAPGHP